MERNQEWFNITRVHRNDLIGLGFDGDAVDDATMEHLADLMSKDYVEQLFYLQVGTYAEELGIPRLKEAVNGKMEVPKNMVKDYSCLAFEMELVKASV